MLGAAAVETIGALVASIWIQCSHIGSDSRSEDRISLAIPLPAALPHDTADCESCRFQSRQRLLHRAICLGDGGAMVPDSREVGIGEGNLAESSAPDNCGGSNFPVFAKEEAGLCAKIRVTPAVQ